ncbi:hypothetical protein [Anabaena sp. UHCC 0253]|uniref:hypothetical protein n=1 Tax=Anabaena sp. UHCC 0253 TaxID=2590019 RepID=UPI0020C59C88|nr:hypothetical protein [Anabaena sp. UHCC 0253]
MSHRIRQAGKEISNRSIVAEVRDRETFLQQKKTKKNAKKKNRLWLKRLAVSEVVLRICLP